MVDFRRTSRAQIWRAKKKKKSREQQSLVAKNNTHYDPEPRGRPGQASEELAPERHAHARWRRRPRGAEQARGEGGKLNKGEGERLKAFSTLFGRGSTSSSVLFALSRAVARCATAQRSERRA